MQDYASVFRTGDVLKEGCMKMAEIYNELEDIKVNAMACGISTPIENYPNSFW